MPFLIGGRGLVKGEEPVDIVTDSRGIYGSRGLVRGEQIRKRFIRPRNYWGPIPGVAPSAITSYPYIGGGYYPA